MGYMYVTNVAGLSQNPIQVPDKEEPIRESVVQCKVNSSQMVVPIKMIITTMVPINLFQMVNSSRMKTLKPLVRNLAIAELFCFISGVVGSLILILVNLVD